MKLQFWSIGKQHEGYIDQGVKDFTRRINNYYVTSWTIIAPVKQAATLSAADLKKKEAASVLKMLNDQDFLIVLDEKGKQLHSRELATMIGMRANESTRNLIFFIGGAFGTDASLLQRANLLWSLSTLTFPHQLVRLILAEQVYRACTILRNEKYHHD